MSAQTSAQRPTAIVKAKADLLIAEAVELRKAKMQPQECSGYSEHVAYHVASLTNLALEYARAVEDALPRCQVQVRVEGPRGEHTVRCKRPDGHPPPCDIGGVK